MIEGGISKRTEPKLPISKSTQDAATSGRKLRPNSVVTHGSRMADQSATEKRGPNTSHQDHESGKAAHNTDPVPSGLAAALMSYSEKNANKM